MAAQANGTDETPAGFKSIENGVGQFVDLLKKKDDTDKQKLDSTISAMERSQATSLQTSLQAVTEQRTDYLKVFTNLLDAKNSNQSEKNALHDMELLEFIGIYGERFFWNFDKNPNNPNIPNNQQNGVLDPKQPRKKLCQVKANNNNNNRNLEPG